MGRQELDVSTVGEQLALSLALEVLLAAERGEAPVLGDNDLLAARELVLRATESLEGKTTVCSSLVTLSCRSRQGQNILESRVRTDMMIWPMLTRATRPLGFPKAPRIPVCSLSAPAHDNILLMRTTWKG